MNNETIKKYIGLAILATIVIGGGLFVFTQFLEWHYATEFLATPCELCVRLNPNYTRCNLELVRTEDINKISWSVITPNK